MSLFGLRRKGDLGDEWLRLSERIREQQVTLWQDRAKRWVDPVAEENIYEELKRINIEIDVLEQYIKHSKIDSVDISRRSEAISERLRRLELFIFDNKMLADRRLKNMAILMLQELSKIHGRHAEAHRAVM